MIPPRLHIVTDDAVLADPRFAEVAAEVLRACRGAAPAPGVRAAQPTVALHLRGHGLKGAELYRIAERLRAVAPAEARLLVNDRVDVALAAGFDGVQLGRRSIPVRSARELLGPEALVGYSAHAAEEAVAASEADFVVLGAIYETASHPGEAGRGLDLILGAVDSGAPPVIAIGGITPERVCDVVAAGAWGVAVLGGIWRDADPPAAARRYLAALAAAAEGC